MTKDEQISEELEKLNRLFERIPNNKKELCSELMQNAAFMAVTLRELQEEVTKNGAMIYGKSGNGFETIKDNPAQKAYTTLISRYTVIIDKLADLLPEEAAQSKLEAFLND